MTAAQERPLVSFFAELLEGNPGLAFGDEITLIADHHVGCGISQSSPTTKRKPSLLRKLPMSPSGDHRWDVLPTIPSQFAADRGPLSPIKTSSSFRWEALLDESVDEAAALYQKLIISQQLPPVQPTRSGRRTLNEDILEQDEPLEIDATKPGLTAQVQAIKVPTSLLCLPY
mmetsp:Transcript_29645/g.49154  ORF Transcript_29645/g.49154 Transcript_29645/m.49154 type:complete len:172 (+) Transcript_29645:201-716(+)